MIYCFNSLLLYYYYKSSFILTILSLHVLLLLIIHMFTYYRMNVLNSPPCLANRNSDGFVYLQFENTQAATSAQHVLHGRWFAGKTITATFIVIFIFSIRYLYFPYSIKTRMVLHFWSNIDGCRQQLCTWIERRLMQ